MTCFKSKSVFKGSISLIKLSILCVIFSKAFCLDFFEGGSFIGELLLKGKSSLGILG